MALYVPLGFAVHYAYGELAFQQRNAPSLPGPNNAHHDDARPGNGQKNRIIPGCPYPGYYNYADQEQTEYWGQADELCVFV